MNAARSKPLQLSRELSVALVGGIHELILQQSEKGDLSGLADLAKVAADFVRRVFSETEDLSEGEWLQAASTNEAFDFLNDAEEGIYSLADGKPLNR